MASQVESRRGSIRTATNGRKKLPLALLTAYVFLLPFQITIALTEDNLITVGPSDLALFALLVFGAERLRIVRPAWTIWHTALIFLLPINAIVVSVLVEPVTLSTVFAKVIGMATLSLLYLSITTFVSSWHDARRLLSVLVKVVVVQNIVVTGFYVAGIAVPFVNGDGSRLTGMLPDPNAYGGLLITTFALLIATASSDTPLLGHRATRIAAITLPFSLALTTSRTTFVAFGVVLILYAMVRPGATLRYLIVSGAALLVIAVLVAPELAQEQMTLSSRGTGGRFELATAMIDAFWSSPVFGVGVGQFLEQHGQIIHLTVGWFLGEFGLIGFTIIVGLLGTIAFRAVTLYRTTPEPDKSTALGLGLAFAGMATMSLGIEALYQRWWWVLMAVIAAMHSLSSHQDRDISRSSDAGFS